MDEIARIAGVSKATVSRVVNQKAEGVSDATRKRIQELLDRMGYQASPVFSAGTNAKTKTIGLIVPDITNPFFPRLVEAVEEIASLNGYLVLLGNTNFSSEKEDGYISAFIAKKSRWGLFWRQCRADTATLTICLKSMTFRMCW